MAFVASDVKPGFVGYFVIDALRGSASVRRTGGTKDKESRPVLCYAVTSAESFWAPMTHEFRRERTKLNQWLERAGAPVSWADTYLNDGLCTYAGPVSVFVTLSGPQTSSRTRLDVSPSATTV